MPKGASRSWWRDYFIDHPAFKKRMRESLANPDAKIGDAKPKVMCNGCLPVRINQESLRDREEMNRGARQEMRDEPSVVDWRKYLGLLLTRPLINN